MLPCIISEALKNHKDKSISEALRGFEENGNHHGTGKCVLVAYSGICCQALTMISNCAPPNVVLVKSHFQDQLLFHSEWSEAYQWSILCGGRTARWWELCLIPGGWVSSCTNKVSSAGFSWAPYITSSAQTNPLNHPHSSWQCFILGDGSGTWPFRAGYSAFRCTYGRLTSEIYVITTCSRLTHSFANWAHSREKQTTQTDRILVDPCHWTICTTPGQLTYCCHEID